MDSILLSIIVVVIPLYTFQWALALYVVFTGMDYWRFKKIDLELNYKYASVYFYTLCIFNYIVTLIDFKDRLFI